MSLEGHYALCFAGIVAKRYVLGVGDGTVGYGDD